MGPGWSPARRLWPLLWRRLVSQRAGPAVASVPWLPRLAERWLPPGPATCLTPSLTRGLHHGPQPEERTAGDARLQPGAAGTGAGQMVAGPDLGSPGLPCVLRRSEADIRADAELGGICEVVGANFASHSEETRRPWHVVFKIPFISLATSGPWHHSPGSSPRLTIYPGW